MIRPFRMPNCCAPARPSGCAFGDGGPNIAAAGDAAPPAAPPPAPPLAMISRRSSRQRNHTNPAIRLVPAMSSRSTCSAVAASRSPGSASSIACRRYDPPCVPTSCSMPWRCGSTSIECTVRLGPMSTCIDAASTTNGSPLVGVTRSRERPTRCSGVPSPSGHPMSMVDVRRTDPGTRSGVPLTEPGSVTWLGSRASAVIAPLYVHRCFHKSWTRSVTSRLCAETSLSSVVSSLLRRARRSTPPVGSSSARSPA